MAVRYISMTPLLLPLLLPLLFFLSLSSKCHSLAALLSRTNLLLSLPSSVASRVLSSLPLHPSTLSFFFSISAFYSPLAFPLSLVEKRWGKNKYSQDEEKRLRCNGTRSFQGRHYEENKFTSKNIRSSKCVMKTPTSTHLHTQN